MGKAFLFMRTQEILSDAIGLVATAVVRSDIQGESDGVPSKIPSWPVAGRPDSVRPAGVDRRAAGPEMPDRDPDLGDVGRRPRC